MSEKPGWFTGLARLLGVKPERELPGMNSLLAFASESTADPQTASIVDEVTDPPSASVPEPISRSLVRPPVVPPSPIARKPALVSDPSAKARLTRPVLIIVSLVVLCTLAVTAYPFFPTFRSPATAPQSGNLTIETRPAGSEVFVDNERRGVSPLTLALTAGSHSVVIRYGSDERTIPLTITPGADVSRYYEMKAEPVVGGGISVVTDPPGATVTIDGQPRGVSPLTVTDLPAADHQVIVTGDTGTAERVVTVASGSTAAVTFSLPRLAGPVGGWLSIGSPFEVELVERGEVIGSSAMTRIMLSAGRHDIVLANRALGFAETRRIDVTPGRTTAIRIDPPTALVSVNARPWADVIFDGESIGQTPIANVEVSIGSHDVIFRHPQLGERKQTVLVTMKGPNRIAVDFSK